MAQMQSVQIVGFLQICAQCMCLCFPQWRWFLHRLPISGEIFAGTKRYYVRHACNRNTARPTVKPCRFLTAYISTPDRREGRPSKKVRDSRADNFCLPVVALIQFLREELDRKHREFCSVCSSSVCFVLVLEESGYRSGIHTQNVSICKYKSHLKHQHLLDASRRLGVHVASWLD